MEKNNIIALTCGDVNSIAPLITFKAWNNLKNTNFMFFTIANKSHMENVSKYFNLNMPIMEVNSPQEAQNIFNTHLPILNIKEDIQGFLGDKLVDNAKITLQSLNEAINLCKNGKIQGFCTNPIDKNIINQYLQNSFYFKGHTEYIAEQFNNQNPLMILANEVGTLRVLPLTTHIPLNDVAKNLSKDFILKNLIILNNVLSKQFNIAKPKIAVLGLNPHCGDGGIMGVEEKDFINDAIIEATRLNIDAIGTIPADSAFNPLNINKYDCIVGMYHDQVLAPFKALCFENGVNITANLDYIRTSPDHGVAFDIAKENIATPNSLISAIKMAHNLQNIRKKW
jgi:4-hydroxythreonine-4-phosphate dehydrogenase